MVARGLRPKHDGERHDSARSFHGCISGRENSSSDMSCLAQYDRPLDCVCERQSESSAQADS